MVHEDLLSARQALIASSNMRVLYLVQRFGEISRSIFMRNIPIRRMTTEKLILAFQRVRQTFLSVDVLLASVNNTDEAKFERINAASEDIKRIGAGIHEVEFGEDSNGSAALRVDGAGKFKRF